jgi:clan AA aspartic protease
MGQIYAEIELINAHDKELMKKGTIDKDEIRSMRVLAMVDTGSIYMAINENIQQILQLPVVGKERSILANGQVVECDKVFPLEVRFENRTAHCSALVLPNDSEPLLGAIPMEEMDVLINPKRQELIVNPQHPHYAITSLRTIPRTYPAT